MAGKRETEFLHRANWLILAKFGQMFNNEDPSMTLPEYAVYFSQFHIVEAVPEYDRVFLPI